MLIELNEINFDIVSSYLKNKPGRFPGFEKCFAGKLIRTSSEKNYKHLEPWIQWPSVHSGEDFAAHKIFRLGDVVHSSIPQIFEEVENKGYRVGVVSAMNVSNRLKSPSYFLPDPWTQTHSDSNVWSRLIHSAVSQAVNDNSNNKITLRSVLYLIISFARFARLKHYLSYFRLAFFSGNASWRKAIFLDLLIHDFHLSRLNSTKTEFSTVFFNAGAHIQHHYLFNCKYLPKTFNSMNPSWYISAKEDPIGEMLEVYDSILTELLDVNDIEVIVATGLSQKPYDKIKYYYRLRDHGSFLGKIGVNFKLVIPRMTRDFLIEFSSAREAVAGQMILNRVEVKGAGKKLFAEIENRGTSLFVTLTYPDEITVDTLVSLDGMDFLLLPNVAFVALKNGMHQEKGYAYFSDGVKKYAPAEGAHVKEIYFCIKRFFGITI